MLIESTHPLLVAQILRVLPELVFQLPPQLVAVLQVHETATARGTVADGHPSGQEVGVAAAQEELVVVDAGCQAAGAIVAHHGALEHGFLFPAHEVAHEAAEGGVVAEGFVFGGGVGGFEELDALGLGVAADALEGERVVGRVEDAVAGVGVGCEKACWGEVMEVAEGSWVSYWMIISAINFRRGLKTHCSRIARTSSLGRRFLIQM